MYTIFSESFPILKLSHNFDSNYIISKAKKDWIFVSMICENLRIHNRFSVEANFFCHFNLEVYFYFCFVCVCMCVCGQVRSYIGNRIVDTVLANVPTVNVVANFNATKKSSSKVGAIILHNNDSNLISKMFKIIVFNLQNSFYIGKKNVFQEKANFQVPLN